MINRLGLDAISPFKPREKIVEYLVQDRLESGQSEYKHMSLQAFVDVVAARTSLPGGGSVSALVACLGSALACMGTQLTYGNKKFEALDAQIRSVLPQFYASYRELLDLCDQDAKSFNAYMVNTHKSSAYSFTAYVNQTFFFRRIVRLFLHNMICTVKLHLNFD